MSAIVQTLIPRTELAYRSSNGIEVSLLWSPADDGLAVLVSDDNAASFELVVSPAEAMDVFHHPYAYAAYRGLELAVESPLRAAA